MCMGRHDAVMTTWDTRMIGTDSAVFLAKLRVFPLRVWSIPDRILNHTPVTGKPPEESPKVLGGTRD